MSSQRRALDSKTSESLAYPALASATTSATSLVLPQSILCISFIGTC